LAPCFTLTSNFTLSLSGRKKDMARRLVTIDLLFCIGVILVVFGHAYLPRGANPDWYEHLRSFIYEFHMPLFFAISGFLLRHTWRGEYWSSVRFRAKRLLIPYAVISLVVVVPLKWGLASYTANPAPGDVWGVVSVLLFPWQSPVTSYWFLPTLFMISLLNPFWVFVSRRSSRSGLVLAAMLALTIAVPRDGPQFLNYWGVLHYSAFYVLGAVTYDYRNEIKRLGGWPALIALSVGMLLAYNCVGPLAMRQAITAPLGIAICYGIAERIKLHGGARLFQPMLGYYYQIYLLSWFVHRGVIVLHNTSGIGFALLFPASFLGALILPVFFAKMIERYLPAFAIVIGLQTTTSRAPAHGDDAEGQRIEQELANLQPPHRSPHTRAQNLRSKTSKSPHLHG
jgi:fucose 4-O-acetylase-like acetyltransferase